MLHYINCWAQLRILKINRPPPNKQGPDPLHIVNFDYEAFVSL